MIIRRLTVIDDDIASEIARVFKKAEEKKINTDSFLEDKDNFLIAALADNKPVGFLLAYKLDRIDTQKPSMFLYEIEVLENYRRIGLAKMMIDELKRFCVKDHYVKMFVICDGDSTSAAGLYQSTGGRRKEGNSIVFEYRCEPI